MINIRRSFVALLKGIRDPKWFLSRMRQEQIYPTTMVSKFIADLKIIACRKRSNTESIENILAFFYDLSCCPVTFDFVVYLAEAELYRRRQSISKIDVIIVKKDEIDEFALLSKEYSEHVNSEELKFRIHEIFFGSSRLLTSVRTIVYIDRQSALSLHPSYQHVFPANYHPCKPICSTFISATNPKDFFPMLESPPHATKLIQQVLKKYGGKKIVTITLREYGYLPARNSIIEAWIEFANSLSPEYQPIFIPDATSYCSEFRDKLKNQVIFDSVCWNVTLRAALYKAAWMNLAVANGPFIIAQYIGEANSLMFYKVDSYPEVYWRDIEKAWGDQRGVKRPYFSERQHWAFMEDTFENIRIEFNNFERIIKELG